MANLFDERLVPIGSGLVETTFNRDYSEDEFNELIEQINSGAIMATPLKTSLRKWPESPLQMIILFETLCARIPTIPLTEQIPNLKQNLTYSEREEGDLATQAMDNALRRLYYLSLDGPSTMELAGYKLRLKIAIASSLKRILSWIWTKWRLTNDGVYPMPNFTWLQFVFLVSYLYEDMLDGIFDDPYTLSSFPGVLSWPCDYVMDHDQRALQAQYFPMFLNGLHQARKRPRSWTPIMEAIAQSGYRRAFLHNLDRFYDRLSELATQVRSMRDVEKVVVDFCKLNAAVDEICWVSSTLEEILAKHGLLIHVLRVAQQIQAVVEDEDNPFLSDEDDRVGARLANQVAQGLSTCIRQRRVRVVCAYINEGAMEFLFQAHSVQKLAGSRPHPTLQTGIEDLLMTLGSWRVAGMVEQQIAERITPETLAKLELDPRSMWCGFKEFVEIASIARNPLPLVRLCQNVTHSQDIAAHVKRTRMHYCSHCQAVVYCSPLCQKRDWNLHRLECSAFKRIARHQRAKRLWVTHQTRQYALILSNNLIVVPAAVDPDSARYRSIAHLARTLTMGDPTTWRKSVLLNREVSEHGRQLSSIPLSTYSLVLEREALSYWSIPRFNRIKEVIEGRWDMQMMVFEQLWAGQRFWLVCVGQRAFPLHPDPRRRFPRMVGCSLVLVEEDVHRFKGVLDI